MDRTRMDKQYDFLREIDKEKSIFRQTYLADGSRKENDAESFVASCDDGDAYV